MNTTELVVEKGPEKNSGPHRFEPMTTVIPDLTSQLTSQLGGGYYVGSK